MRASKATRLHRSSPDGAVTGEMTVQNLATELAKRAARHEAAVGLVAH